MQYLPGIILLLIGGLPLLSQVTAPNRFIAGEPRAEAVRAAALEADVRRLRERVAGLERELKAMRASGVLALDRHVQLIPDDQDGVATLRFSGVNLRVVNRQGVVLDTAGTGTTDR